MLIVVVDDDRAQAESLIAMISRSAALSAYTGRQTDGTEEAPSPDIRWMGSAAELEQSCVVDGSHPDVVFMDIELEPEVNGIDVVTRLFPRGSDTQVVYVTGYDSYHSRVYQTQHCGFLLKPITQDAVDTALTEVFRRRLESMERPVLVGVGSDGRVILPRDVQWVESDRRLLHIHLRNGVVTTYLRLSQLSERFPERFVQCHKSFLVNLDYVKSWSGNQLVMLDDTVIPVSQRRRAATKAAIMNYARAVR